jgi:serine/threonine protein kinase
LTHDHIIKLLATYQQEGIYHFLFPLADCSLEKYMHNDPLGFKDPDSQTSKQFIAWIIGQFQGIASGLAKIHVNSGDNSSKKRGATLGKELRPQLLNPSVAAAQRQRPEGTGYHHDLKPQNILHFPAMADTQNPTSDYGIFQIADFGIGKFHSLNSGSGTGTFRGTQTYAAPESKVFVKSHSKDKKDTKPGLKLSRPYDIWSLGCVLLEVTVWLVFGTDGLTDFNDERCGPERAGDSGSVTSDCYFILTNHDGPQVRDTVCLWMKKLREDPRLKKNTGASLLGLLNLIEEKILVCDPKHRMPAEDVEEGLSELTRMAEKEAAQGGAEPLSTIVEVPSHEGDPLNGSETQPPSRTSSPIVRVQTPETVEAESAASSTSNSPKRKSAKSTSTDFRTSHSLANPHPGSSSHLPQHAAYPTTKMPPPSRSSTLKSAATVSSSRRGSDASTSTSSSLRVQKYESHSPGSPQ